MSSYSYEEVQGLIKNEVGLVTNLFERKIESLESQLAAQAEDFAAAQVVIADAMLAWGPIADELKKWASGDLPYQALALDGILAQAPKVLAVVEGHCSFDDGLNATCTELVKGDAGVPYIWVEPAPLTTPAKVIVVAQEDEK